MQLHLALDLIHHFVGRIDMELAAIFAAARHERERFRFLPKHAHALAFIAELTRLVRQIHDRHFGHVFGPRSNA
jgi:hypothetical protein